MKVGIAKTSSKNINRRFAKRFDLNQKRKRPISGTNAFFCEANHRATGSPSRAASRRRRSVSLLFLTGLGFA
jgi:hypothetical protein